MTIGSRGAGDGCGCRHGCHPSHLLPVSHRGRVWVPSLRETSDLFPGRSCRAAGWLSEGGNAQMGWIHGNREASGGAKKVVLSGRTWPAGARWAAFPASVLRPAGCLTPCAHPTLPLTLPSLEPAAGRNFSSLGGCGPPSLGLCVLLLGGYGIHGGHADAANSGAGGWRWRRQRQRHRHSGVAAAANHGAATSAATAGGAATAAAGFDQQCHR